MAGMGILGLGHDVVDVAAFAAQLAESGTRMRRLFSVRETRQAAMRARSKGDGEAVHLAAKWAGKEAVLKAWEEALGDSPSPYTLDDFPWSRIEILDDGRGRPHVVPDSDVHRTLIGSLFPDSLPFGSLSSDSLTPASRPDASLPDASRSDASRPPVFRPDASRPDAGLAWHLSLSHDGPIASAVALLVAS